MQKVNVTMENAFHGIRNVNPLMRVTSDKLQENSRIGVLNEGDIVF